MPPLQQASTPQKQRSGILRHKSAEPLPPMPPSKPIDLNSSTRSTDRESGNKYTRRAFLIDVVVEQDGQETTSLLANLGEPLKPPSTLPPPLPVANGRPATPSRLALPPASDREHDQVPSPGWSGERQEAMADRLANLIDELIRTEKSYLSRIHALKHSYADRLRLFSKDPNQQLIPPYEAKAMFANIEAIVPASAAFLADLEAMAQAGHGEKAVGDVCLKHFKQLGTFDPYRTYLSKQDESQKLFQESLRKFPGFGSFIESTKYQTTGIGNIGLRELLMEPVQRIPRYTLLWQTMVKCMSPLSVQRAKLVEATEIASRIARCEPDAQTVRASVMYNLERNIEDFPAKLFSNSRDFIDSIDVEDLPAEYPTTTSPPSRPLSTLSGRPLSTSSTSTPSMASFGSLPSSAHPNQFPQAISYGLSPLHCTLFLFDDKLMIVKRQSSSISGRKVTGTDDVQNLVKSGGGVALVDRNGGKKDKLSFRGMVDILDVIASDVGNGEFHLFLERPPMDQSGRWSARPFRSYTTVHPPYSVALDPVLTRRDKLRFIENLWAAQALARAKVQSHDERSIPRILTSETEVSLEAAGELFGRAKCYWNIWGKTGWAGQRKAKVLVQIDEEGIAQGVPPDDDGPLLVVRLLPMAGGLCRFSYSTSETTDEERIVIAMNEVTERIANTVHRYGIFKFRTGTTSCPTTPSAASHRLRPSMLNLDAISRNLFGAGSVSGRAGTTGETYSTTSSKRASRSIASRSSTLDTSRMSSEMSEESNRARNSRRSHSPSEGLFSSFRNEFIAGAPYKHEPKAIEQSEVDLNERLNMARRNSRTMETGEPQPAQLGTKSVAQLRKGLEEQTLQEAEALLRATPVEPPTATTAPLRIRKTPSPTRPFSPPLDTTPRTLFAGTSSQGFAPLHVGRTPNPAQSLLPAEEHLFMSPDMMGASPAPRLQSSIPLSPRPSGPRSPLPGPRSPPVRPITQISNIGSAHTKLRIVSGGGRRISVGRETVPLKGGDENDLPDAQSTPTGHMPAKRQHSTDNMTPRKRSPTRSPLHPREVSDGAQTIAGPLKSANARRTSGTRRTSGRQGHPKFTGPLTTSREVSASQTSITSAGTSATVEDAETRQYPDLIAALQASSSKVHDALGSTKRLKSELSGLRKQMGKDAKPKDLVQRLDRNTSLPRSPQKRNINRIADPDMYESISSRHSSGKHEMDVIVMDECARGIASIVDRVESHLHQAQIDHQQALSHASGLDEERRQQTHEMQILQDQVLRSKETRDLLERQLGDVQIELDVIYEAFNTELDGMFSDAQLPETEAFQALQQDLRTTKASRNLLDLENKKLKRELEEANLQREQWAKMLRVHGYEV